MPIQKEVRIKSVEISEGRGYTVTFNLTCWVEGVIKEYPVENSDGTIDMKNAIIYQDFSGLVKGQVEGLTETDLISRITEPIQTEMQEGIDNHVAKDKIETGASLETVRFAIEGGLTG